MGSSANREWEPGESANSLFEKWAPAAIAGFESKLEPKLQQNERDALFSAGSIIMLESLDMAVHFFQSKQKLEADLADFCRAARPRPAETQYPATASQRRHHAAEKIVFAGSVPETCYHGTGRSTPTRRDHLEPWGRAIAPT